MPGLKRVAILPRWLRKQPYATAFALAGLGLMLFNQAYSQTHALSVCLSVTLSRSTHTLTRAHTRTHTRTHARTAWPYRPLLLYIKYHSFSDLGVGIVVAGVVAHMPLPCHEQALLLQAAAFVDAATKIKDTEFIPDMCLDEYGHVTQSCPEGNSLSFFDFMNTTMRQVLNRSATEANMTREVQLNMRYVGVSCCNSSSGGWLCAVVRGIMCVQPRGNVVKWAGASICTADAGLA